MVIDDLTELLRAQKAAAWQEVAQRIAHEIKNPLTPIQLSAQRLLRYLDRTATSSRNVDRAPNSKSLPRECAGLIEREVQTLESLVEEFSQFARFPAARLAAGGHEYDRRKRAATYSTAGWKASRFARNWPRLCLP